MQLLDEESTLAKLNLRSCGPTPPSRSTSLQSKLDLSNPSFNFTQYQPLTEHQPAYDTPQVHYHGEIAI